MPEPKKSPRRKLSKLAVVAVFDRISLEIGETNTPLTREQALELSDLLVNAVEHTDKYKPPRKRKAVT